MLEVQPGRFYKVKNVSKKSSANDHYNMVVVENNLGELEELLFTDSDLMKAVVRRRKNKEDIPPYTVKVDNGGLIYPLSLLMIALLGGIVGYYIKNSGLF
jgi:hypothetical protein